MGTPEGDLVRVARLARRLTIEEAAPKIDISPSRWSQIETGYVVRKGTQTAVTPQPGILAHMAKIVGLTPKRLEDVGRADAAEVLREIIKQTASPLPTVEPDEYPDVVGTDPFYRYIWDGPAPEMERRMAIMGVEMYRAASPNAPSERDGRKHA